MVWTEIRGPQLLASLADFVGENWALLARIPLVVGPMEQETEDSWDDQRGIEVREPPDVVWGYKNEAGNEVPESRGYLRQVPMTARSICMRQRLVPKLLSSGRLLLQWHTIWRRVIMSDSSGRRSI